MAYQVFARKYRPLTFAQVLGQDHVIQTLRNAIEQNRIAQAYLFVGPRGTGKTTTARILAKALNCSNGPRIDFDPNEDICKEIAEGNSLDVLEIDGASNNGVEQVRELRDNTKFAPSRGRYKIYYIDEVHMLTTAAFNALLKTLEEPPPHVKFIFATTEPNKILPTILSRCQRFDLRPIPDKTIAEHLLHIADEEGIKLDSMAAFTIAKGADGGMRDAQSMLDQLVAFCGEHITEAQVLDIFGFTPHETVAEITSAILEKQTVAALGVLHRQNESGKDLTKLLADLISYLRNLLVYQVDPENATKDLAAEIVQTLEKQAAQIATDRLLELIDQFAEVDARMKWAPNKKMHFEIGIIKAVQSLRESNLSDVIAALGGALPNQESTPAPSKAQLTQRAAASSSVAKVVTPEPSAAKPPESQQPRTEEPSVKPVTPAKNDDALWKALQEKLPLLLGQAAFGGERDGKWLIRFHPDDIKREIVKQKKNEIESFLSEQTGRSLRMEVVADETIELPEVPPLDLSTDAKGDSSSTSIAPPEPLDEKAFYDDPLIQKALDMFKATLDNQA